MAIISFPSAPSTNQTFTVGSKTWIYNGYAWDLQLANAASVFAQANAAFDKANSANVLAQAAYNQANTANSTDYTTISTTAGVYGNGSYIPVTTLTANGRVSSITNTAIAIDTAAITSGTLSVARGGTGVTTSTGTGAVVLNTSPTLSTPTVDRVDWPAVGYAPPSLTSRSSGTKLTLYPSLSSTSVDYAFGIDGGTLWSSIPAANSCLLYTSPSPRDRQKSRMPSSA